MRARLDLAKRRLRVVRSHIGFRFFIGWLVIAASLLVLLTFIPRQQFEEHKVVLAFAFALTSFAALFMLAYALLDAATKERLRQDENAT